MYNPFSLKGKMVLVTGASSGIGRATAVECSKMGAIVIASARKEDLLKELMTELEGEGHSYIVADVTNSEQLKALAKTVSKCDGVVLCAGIVATIPVKFCSPDRFHDIFNVNFFSTCELVRLLYKDKKIKKQGSIVLISSIGGVLAHNIGNSIYDASKAALDSFMKSCSREFSSRLIRVNSVCPGMVNTKLTQIEAFSKEDKEADFQKYLLKRYGEPEDVAHAVVYLLSDAASWVTGHALVIDGGVTCI